MSKSVKTLGRVRRVGLDTTINYTLLGTSNYNAQDPAASTGALTGGGVALDQDLDTVVPDGVELTVQGILVTFERACPNFRGVIAKVRPTYRDLGINTSAIELWTHDSVTDAWTLRRRILFSNAFEGTRSGEAKYFDLRAAVSRSNVDKVWVTMAPDDSDSPVMRFSAVHAYGQCHLVIETPGDCHADPNIDCIDPEPCDVAPNDPTCTVPPLDCKDFGPDMCDLPPFVWPDLPSIPPYPDPKFKPPNVSLVDLCNPAALQAFKDSMTPEQLAYFEELLSHTELPCTPVQQAFPIDPVGDQPGEEYMDPQGRRIQDPRGDAPSQTILMQDFLVCYDTDTRDEFIANLAHQPQTVQDSYLGIGKPKAKIVIWGLPSLRGGPETTDLTRFEFNFSGSQLVDGDIIATRILGDNSDVLGTTCGGLHRRAPVIRDATLTKTITPPGSQESNIGVQWDLDTTHGTFGDPTTSGPKRLGHGYRMERVFGSNTQILGWKLTKTDPAFLGDPSCLKVGAWFKKPYPSLKHYFQYSVRNIFLVQFAVRTDAASLHITCTPVSDQFIDLITPAQAANPECSGSIPGLSCDIATDWTDRTDEEC